MTKTDIKEQLAAKELALKNLLKENNLSIKTALTAEELAVLEQAYLLLGVAEAPQDIGKNTFINYVQNWVKDFISILDEEKRTDIEIDVADIITSLRGKIKKPKFPISMILWDKLKMEMDKLSSPTTPEGLRKALLSGFNNFKTEMVTKFELTEHFKKNRTTYNQIKKKNLDENVMIANDFEDWLKPILDGAKAEEKEKEKTKKAEEREKEKAKKAEEKELLDLFKVWKKEFSAEMSKEDTLHDKNLVSLGKLKKNLKVALGYTEMYTKPIIDALSIQLKEKAFAVSDSITVKELKKYLVEITLTLDNHIDWKWQMKLWRANNRGFMFPIPPAVHGAITDSELNVSEERFLELVQETVYKSNLSIVDTIAQNKGWEKINDTKEITFDGAILKSEFKMAFSKKIQSITPLEFVYSQLEINLKDGKISLDDFKLIWEKSIQESYQQSKDKSSSVYHKWVAEQKLWHVEQALDSLAPFFPTIAILTSVLEEAKNVPNKKVRPKLHQYGNGHTTNFTCSLAWDPVESIIEIAGREASDQSLFTKIKEGLKSLGKGAELVIEELEGVGKILRLDISNFTFDVKIPMKLTEQYNSKGEKFVAAVPNNLDSSYIKFKGDSSYFGVEVLTIEPLTELPKFDGRNLYDQDSFISTQDIKLTLEILDPQVSVSLSTVAGVELGKHPTKSTVDLIFTIYSSYNLKENKVETNVKNDSINYKGGERMIKSIEVTKKEKLELKVFK